jgi:carbon monoxide dehydrogenase subunit G
LLHRRYMRWLVVSVALVLAASSAVAAPGITITQDSDPAVTLGDAVIDGDPADVFAEVSDFRKWAQVMPDVASVEIHGQKGNEAQVTLVSPSGHRDNLHFRITPATHVVWFEDTGNNGRADVWAQITLMPTGQAGTTHVHILLYAKIHGVARIVIHEGRVRAEREQKIAAELTHMREYFRRRVANN